MKIATWNVNSLRVRLPQLLTWLVAEQPDVVALQETKVVDAQFPVTELEAAGYNCLFAGQKAYNGVALLCRQPLRGVDVVVDFATGGDEQRRLLVATVGGVRIVNIYVPNGGSVDSDKYLYKLAWLDSFKLFLEQMVVQYPATVILGDFNIAPEDRDVYDPVAWAGQVLATPAEREALGKVLEMGFFDAFRLFQGESGFFSWWDYRAAAFRRNLGVRIDLILVSEGLKTACRGCWVDKMPRGWARPSDHAPVLLLLDV